MGNSYLDPNLLGKVQDLACGLTLAYARPGLLIGLHVLPGGIHVILGIMLNQVRVFCMNNGESPKPLELDERFYDLPIKAAKASRLQASSPLYGMNILKFMPSLTYSSTLSSCLVHQSPMVAVSTQLPHRPSS